VLVSIGYLKSVTAKTVVAIGYYENSKQHGNIHRRYRKHCICSSRLSSWSRNKLWSLNSIEMDFSIQVLRHDSLCLIRNIISGHFDDIIRELVLL
jgi:hypothetical protein